MDWLAAALFGAFGAFTLRFIELLETERLKPVDRPDFRDWLYWLPFVGLPLVGGGLAAVYVVSGSSLTAIAAMNIGVTAPLTIRAWYSGAQGKRAPIDTPEGA